MRLLDLFSGIGGLSLGFERAGFQTVAFCEIDARCRRVLAKHWPGVTCYDDIRTMPQEWVDLDVIAGGPPCQRTSVAAAIHGKRTGETLWPYMRALLPNVSRAVVEQPPGNEEWEDQVQADLEEFSFGVSRHVIAACEVGGVNPRRRVFLVADRDRARLALTRVAITSAVDRLQGGAPDGNHWSPASARAVRVVDGLPGGLDRTARIRSLGNSVIPQVAEVIARAIYRAEAETQAFFGSRRQILEHS